MLAMTGTDRRDESDDLLVRRPQPSYHLYRNRGLASILLSLLEDEQLTQTVTTTRNKGKITQALIHPVIAESVDFAPILVAFQSLTPGQRIVWLAIACAVVRISQRPPPARWEQRTHANGKLKRYTESEVQRHYGMSAAGIYRAWMHADNVMSRAFREVEWQLHGGGDASYSPSR